MSVDDPSTPLRRDRQSSFGEIFRARYGEELDMSDLRPERYAPASLALARAVWTERVKSEMRSAQLMARFVCEVMGAGDPLDVYAGALALVDDEVRHVMHTSTLLAALGGKPVLPPPLQESKAFLARSMAERALWTAIGMLAVNETLSVGYIQDLAARCANPAVKRVLDTTIDDEQEHESFGWTYVARSLERFGPAARPHWASVATLALAPHRTRASEVLASAPEDERSLDEPREPELAELGLFSRRRQREVTRALLHDVVEPRLAALGLLETTGGQVSCTGPSRRPPRG